MKEKSTANQLDWIHPGGKLRELGTESLTDAELLSILVSTGTKGKSAEDIAREICLKRKTVRELDYSLV